MMFPALLLITLRQWRTHKLRLALTTLGIALGVAVFFAIRTGNSTLLDSLKSTVEKLAGKATLQVTAGESGLPEQVLETVRATPGVRIAEPVIEVIADTSFGDEGRLLVLGVDTTGDRELRDYQFDRSRREIADPLLFLAQPNSILLSRAFADRHSLKLGDRLSLFTSEGRKEFTLRGVFQPVGIGEVFGGNIAVMDVYSAQLVFNRGRNFDRVDLVNSADVPIETVQQRLRERLPGGVDVLRPEVRGEALENAVTAMRVGMLISSFVALLVCIYIIFNSFTIAVNQRWKEIGILRAVGVERRNIRRMFLAEALLMGVLGSLLGIAGGYCLAGAAGSWEPLLLLLTGSCPLLRELPSSSASPWPRLCWGLPLPSRVLGFLRGRRHSWIPCWHCIISRRVKRKPCSGGAAWVRAGSWWRRAWP